MITKQDLIDFEKSIAENFNAGLIRAPIHLSGGNEDQLIELFQRIQPTDWVFSTWRSHYHALLHGVPREQLREKILRGESISIHVPERRFHSSAICGGCLPIALGVAWQCKRGNWLDHVWCFVGDMAAEMGCFHEAVKYAANHDLPVTFVVEDNGKCVNADTAKLWGNRSLVNRADRVPINGNVEVYRYRLTWPHMGTGKFVQFPDEQKFSPTGGM